MVDLTDIDGTFGFIIKDCIHEVHITNYWLLGDIDDKNSFFDSFLGVFIQKWN